LNKDEFTAVAKIKQRATDRDGSRHQERKASDVDASPVKPWPNYKTYNVPIDSTHDGMPDDWELAHGLNPNDPNDRNGDNNHDGNTNLEKYMNSLTGEYTAPPVNQ
jgi:hypothetical protein